MLKKKLFYFWIGCFFCLIICQATAVNYDKKTYDAMEQRMAELEEHNRMQQKNHLKLEDYQKEHSDLLEAKKEEYWDLAWHARLADYGDPESQFIIADAYEYGKSVEEDPKKALSFYKRAAEQGHIESCMRLGRIYTENKWIQIDEEKALYWYRKAAERGYTQACFKISEIYEAEGKYEESYKWLEFALKQVFPKTENLETRSRKLKQLAEKISEKQKDVLIKNE